MKYLWIIDENSSVSIFHRNFTQEGSRLDPDLVSGLLSTLNYFSQMQLPSKQGIESIEMGGLSFVYLSVLDYDLLFVAADEKTSGHNTIKSRLEVIRDIFIKEFELTPQKWKEEFHGDVSKFQSFSIISDILVNQWIEAEKILDKAESFDLLGIFQQIINICLNLTRNNRNEQILKKLGEELGLIIKSEEFQKEKEFLKIDFTLDSGWDIININPSKIPQTILEKLLLRIINKIRNYLIENLDANLLNNEIFPFILNNWGLIRKLEIDREILKIFLAT